MSQQEKLVDFIIRRRREVAEEQERLQAELRALQVEFEQLEKAAKAAGIEENVVATERVEERNAYGMMILKSRPKVVAEKTIKEAVIEILREAGHGMTAHEILPRVNRLLSVDYPRTSLSPQLSRLKAEGILERNGVEWSLAQVAQKEEASPAQAGEASEPEDEGTANPDIFK